MEITNALFSLRSLDQPTSFLIHTKGKYCMNAWKIPQTNYWLGRLFQRKSKVEIKYRSKLLINLITDAAE